MKKTLRPYQAKAIQAVYNSFELIGGNPLVSMATGSGKALTIAQICVDSQQYENQHVIVCVHTKELVEQNYNEFVELCPEITAGIYCAGLGKKQLRKVTFASIQSLTKIKKTPYCDLLIIDEVQALNDEKDESMYASLIGRLKVVNPDMKCVGFSATIWRTDSGLLYEGENRLFSNLAFEYSIAEGVKDGHLVPLISKNAKVQGDRNNIKITAGEFNTAQSAAEFDRESLTEAALDEVFLYGSDRHSWLFFCVTIEHATHVRDALRKRGIHAETVSEKTPQKERDTILRDYKNGLIHALTGVNIAAVGFNATCVDLIAILRPTMSPGWHVQSLGRGTRPHPGRENCLVLDFAGNLANLGPVTHVRPPRRGQKIAKEDAGGRVCVKCDEVSSRDATECVACGYVFPVEERKIKHDKIASNADAMVNEPVISIQPNWFDVRSVSYDIHHKVGSPDSLKVTYRTKAQYVSEWVSFASLNLYAVSRATQWWYKRGGLSPAPETAQSALQRLNELTNFRVKRIKISKEGRFDRIDMFDIVREPITVQQSIGNLGHSTTHVMESLHA